MAKETVIGHVVLIEGVVLARTEDGEQRQLKFGDPVFEGEVIVTMDGARVELGFDQGSKFLMRSKEIVQLDSTVFGNLLPEAQDASLLPRVTEFTQIAKALLDGGSLEQLLDEVSTGATLNGRISEGVVGGLRPDDGNSFVQLFRAVETVAGYQSRLVERVDEPALTDPAAGALEPPRAGGAGEAPPVAGAPVPGRCATSRCSTTRPLRPDGPRSSAGSRPVSRASPVRGAA